MILSDAAIPLIHRLLATTPEAKALLRLAQNLISCCRPERRVIPHLGCPACPASSEGAAEVHRRSWCPLTQPPRSPNTEQKRPSRRVSEINQAPKRSVASRSVIAEPSPGFPDAVKCVGESAVSSLCVVPSDGTQPTTIGPACRRQMSSVR
jgi:hypothetical protein